MNEDYLNLPLRPCVGIALFNTDGRVFVGERLDSQGNWQMPQGGIDEGETIEEAFFRELQEEAGTDKAEILKIMDEPLAYHLPYHLLGRLWNGKWGGQEQTWVAARFTGTDEDINIYAYRYPEFQAWQWAKLDDIPEMIVPFKRETYEKVIEAFREFETA